MQFKTTVRLSLAGLLLVPALCIGTAKSFAQPAINPLVAEQQDKAAKRAKERADAVERERLMMRIYDIEDKPTQDILIDFLTQESAKRDDVRAAREKLQSLMRQKLASDAQVASALADYRAVVAKSKEDYARDLRQLDKQLGYSKNPRLEATLVFLDIIGDEDAYRTGPASFGIYTEPPKANAK